MTRFLSALRANSPADIAAAALVALWVVGLALLPSF